MKNYYEILGISSNASVDEIKAAYRKLALKYHPDTGGSCDVERFLQVQEAYDNLCDSEKRSDYDQQYNRTQKTINTVENRYRARPMFDLFDQNYSIKEESPRSANFRNSHENYLLEIGLTIEEAMKGCQIPVEIPVKFECPYCGGSGILFFFECPWCKGLGRRSFHQPVSIKIPPGIHSETKFHVQMHSVDNQVVEFNVLILIEQKRSKFS